MRNTKQRLETVAVLVELAREEMAMVTGPEGGYGKDSLRCQLDNVRETLRESLQGGRFHAREAQRAREDANTPGLSPLTP